MSDNKQPESIITNDSKIFEQLDKTNPIVFSPSDPETSAKFNFIRYCTEDYFGSDDVAESIVNSIMHQEQFWKQAEKYLLTGLLEAIAESDEPTTASLIKLLHSGTENIIDQLIAAPTSAANASANMLADWEIKIQRGIIGGLIQKLSVLNDPEMVKFTDAEHSFDFAELRTKPTQIFWNIDRSVFPNPLTAIFFSNAFRNLLNNDKGLKVKFLISDLSHLGHIPNFASRIIYFKTNNLAIQTTGSSFDQLAHLYGRDKAKTILENLDVL